eukprot:90045_1
METISSNTKYIIISNDGKTLTSHTDGAGNFNAYGQTTIISTTKNIYTWTFTCHKRRGSIIIGIISTRNVNSMKPWKKIDYGYDGKDGRKYNKGKSNKYGMSWNENDTIEMKVDFSTQEIKYKVNGVDQGVAFNNIKIGHNYYLVVSTGTWASTNIGDSITINSFVVTESNQQTENDNTETDNKEYENKENDTQISILDENKMLKKQNEELLAHNKTLQMENYKLKEENNILLDDKKELELEINRVKQENERLNMRILDYSQWREWNTEQVFYFIMSIVNDGSLMEYENSIKKEIFESEYTGNDLANIEQDDIKSMGIKKISVRKKVLKAIQIMIQSQSQKNEGIHASTAYG